MATELEMAAPSPPSDESSTEGPALREFVQTQVVPERQQAVSPRSAIFSHTSLRTAPMPGRADIIPETKAIVAANSQRHSRRHRDNSGTGSRRKHERDLTHTSASSQRELVKLLIDQEHETSNLRHALATAVQRVQAEAQRVAALEREKQDAVQRSRILDETRQQAQQEASKAAQELRVYELQLENAQKEIERAQNDAKELQRQRDEAEAEAARAKAKARKLHEQTMIATAREEGRQLGFQAGFDQARRERLVLEARKKKAIAHKQPAPRIEEAPPAQQPRYISQPSRIRTGDNDEDYDDDEGSVSRLPLKNFTPVHQDPGPSRLAREEPRHSRNPRSPTEDDYESEGDDPRFAPRSHHNPQRYPRDPRGYPQATGPPHRHQRPPDRPPSPQIQVYSIDIPPQEQIEREFNSREDPNEILARRPREEWVTAQKHREIRAPPPQHARQYPGRAPPPLRVPPQQRPPPPNKSVSFLSRGSLKKTKDQAMSWYRSLSRRRNSNNKPTIDPVPEESPAAVAAASVSPAGPPTFPVPQVGPAFPEPETVPAPAPAHTAAQVAPSAARSAASVRSRASQMQMPVAEPAPPSMRAPSQREESIFGGSSQAAGTWYPPKTAPSVATSMRSRDPVGRRPTSVASTSVSQFALLATPHPGSSGPWMNDDSMREPSQRGGIREKESLLSVIKEDNMSRGHTPSSDRFLPPGAGTSIGGQPAPGMPQPSFGFPQHQFLQHQQSQATMDNRSVRRANKPPSIMVPDPDAPLDPAGVAYMRAQPDVFGGNGANLARQPSRTSQATPGSIKIDVVPPSGVPPQAGQSPLHTGRNHLSPYHVFKPPINGLGLAPAQSMLSMRSQKSGRAQPEYDGGMDTMSRRHSKQSMNMNASNQPSRPPSSLGGAFARVAAPFMQHLESAGGKSPARSARLGLHKPESIASFTSRKTGRGPISLYTQTPRAAPAPVVPESAPMLMAPQQIRRTGSSSSLRSNNSYSRYNPNDYVDPAFWGPDGPSGPPGALLAAGPDPNGRRSASSDLSYA
ncbi:hypothetical protein BJ165DRAFT_1403266 [Panaeolus papilionaceus]|nr:hypothetical protein BJ165DRAFT_1403266 [Panaeolus papilionaceus]